MCADSQKVVKISPTIQVDEIANLELSEPIRARLIKVIEATKRKKHGSVFSQPVDYLKLKLPHYLTIVKYPMDLSTLKKNLKSGEYKLLYEFLEAADLIWTNCMRFNGKDHDFFKFALEVRNEFDDMLYQLDLGLTVENHEKILKGEFKKADPSLVVPLSEAEFGVLAYQISLLSKENLAKIVCIYCRFRDIPLEKSHGKIRMQLDALKPSQVRWLKRRVEEMLVKKKKK
eukprot:gnl/Carplike_NY0171/2489_a3347_630.p1 GENE.gnl/Carplike_NY0171/2489_a3347_630~~gnl/Carplike_NY0171/2489_a3347_630.p1  ORF type:complete len:230 (-),score=25.85 gnl/Carplike_NY0171/2489_a3347_630:39-728(-)